jgi:hypothetical protein
MRVAWQRLQNNVIVQGLALGWFFAWLAVDEIKSATSVYDFDIWWHLRTGQSILSHRAIPHADAFGRITMGQPWIAYSWAFEVLTAALFKALRFSALPALLLVMELAIAFAVFYLAWSLCRHFWTALLVSAPAMYAIYHNLGLRPGLFTILFFALELKIVFSARQGDVKALRWLPLLFLLWCNLHIQFVYGLFVLGLAVAEALAVRVIARFPTVKDAVEPTSIPMGEGFAMLGACVMATFINPYGYKLYTVAFELSRQTGAYEYIGELQALTFRQTAHFMQLIVVLAAFYALGRMRCWPLFLLALLTVATVISFRSTRDSWFSVIPAVAAIASAYRRAEEPEQQAEEAISRNTKLLATATVLLAVMIAASVFRFGNERLAAQIGYFFPADAADFIGSQRLPQPLYNTLNWGGFLIWDLPNFPVSIDGRTNLYGDPMNQRYDNVVRGFPEWRNDPDINSAGTLLVPRGAPIAGQLGADPRFRRVYEDRVAIVFVKNTGDVLQQ